MAHAPDRFQEGTALKYPIYDGSGVLLLNAGVDLTPRLIALLEQRGIRLIVTTELEVLEGGDVGRRIPIPDGVVKIGRSPKCDIRPASKLVSSFHCLLDKMPLSLYFKDMRSTNGSFVNRNRVTKTIELNDGDVIQFGDMGVRVHIEACLEGDGADVERVAGLILADPAGSSEEPWAGDTVETTGEEARLLREALERRAARG